MGVFAKAKGGFFGENGMDSQIVIPLKTAESRYPQVDRYMIVVHAKPRHCASRPMTRSEATLRKIRRVQAGRGERLQHFDPGPDHPAVR